MVTSRKTLFLAAIDHYRAGRQHRAAILLEALIAQNPDDADALRLLGSLRMESDPDAAAALFRRCLAVTPGDAIVLHSLGKLLERRGDDWTAIELFSEAATRSPNFAPTFNDLGAALHRVGEHHSALAAVDRAIAIDPDYTMAYINRGLLLVELRRAKEAHVAFRKVLATPAESPGGWHNVGIAHYNLGDFEQAIAACRRAVALDPSHVAAYATLMEALHRANQADAARRAGAEWASRQNAVVAGCTGESVKARILLIGAADLCNVPTDFLFNRQHFETVAVKLILPGDGTALPSPSIDTLPDFDIAFNAIGDADRGALFLAQAAAFCSKLDAPVLNPPTKIPLTRRDILPSLLNDIPGLAVPTTRRVTRVGLSEWSEGSEWVPPPVLLRPIGSHGGEDLDNRSGVMAFLDAVPADEYYLSDFWDYRSADGYFRKYRLIFVDREVYPYHLAIAKDWLLHYWRADMADWMKREEEAFLADFRSVFRGVAADAVAEVARRIDLDYAGMDCTILPDGRVLLFEANATMLVHLRDSRQGFAYKHAHVPRIIDAVTHLVTRRTAGRAAPASARDQTGQAVAAMHDRRHRDLPNGISKIPSAA
ncbi:MAG: tetratricopeptide repeat protein [Xanthobacteraceae bacterium]